MYDGLNLNLGNLSRLSHARTRSLSPENLSGVKGRGGMAIEGMGASAARDLGQGWKVAPCIGIRAGDTAELAFVDGPGALQQLWMTATGNWRLQILRIYWDHAEIPSVECPLGDFFGMGWCVYAPLNSLAVCVNPGSAFNAYWEMPFQRHCRMTLENLSSEDIVLYYQINYTLTGVPEDAAYFHAQWRRSNPVLKGGPHTILDGVNGHGHYVGTYLAWQVNNTGWWGEGEIKFYLDGDEWPTICGTGTEDYFCGSYNFDHEGQYTPYSTPYAGLHQVIRPDGAYRSQQRFGMYRWHIMDPIRFETDLRVTIQALGWRDGKRYLPLQDDIASTAFWYQTLPTAPFPPVPGPDALEVI